MYPEDVLGNRKELVPHYNRAGALERVTLDGTLYVEQLAYNAKGQRTFIAYGNGVMTAHAYDAETFRLKRLWSGRYSKPAGTVFTYRPSTPSQPLQDFAYEYDLVGNIWKLHERVPGCGILNTLSGQDALDRDFTYDAIYRLCSANGRESMNIPSPRPWTDEHREGYNSGNHGTPNQDNAPQLTRPYTEEYIYDPAGNLVSLKHGQNGLAWTRHFGVGGFTPQQWGQEWPPHFNNPAGWDNPPSNRLTHVGDDQIGFSQTHFFDVNGNLIQETTSRQFEWDHSDRLKSFRTQAGQSEPSVYAHYLYDAGGQRVKKLVRKQGGQIEVTTYMDGIFEYQRIVHGHTVEQNNILHVMENQSRIALIRVGNPFPDDTTPAVKFHLGDHLGSNNLVIDDSGGFINREEYTPYGETSFGSFARKRYRFSGKERDEESGLNYHGTRYYAPWLGRWTSCDPVGIVDGINLYIFVRDNPIKFADSSGNQSHPAPAAGVTPLSPSPPTHSTNSSTRTVDSNGKITLPEVKIVGQATSAPPTSASSSPTQTDVPELTTNEAETLNVPHLKTQGFRNPYAQTLAAQGKTKHAVIWESGFTCSGCHLRDVPEEDIDLSVFAYQVQIAGYTKLLTTILNAVAATSSMPKDSSITGKKGGTGRTPTPSPPSGNPFADLSTAEVDAAVGDMRSKYYYRTPVSVTEQPGRTSLGDLVPASRWGRPGLQPNDWIMPGNPTRINYVMSFKWDPNPLNMVAPRASGQAFMVPHNSISWPSGWESFKGFFGQRIYTQ